MAKVIVTGGAGFVGSNLCKALKKAGNDVIAIDDLSCTDRNVPFLEEIGVTFVRADISDLDSIMRHFAGADTVYHLAAMNRAQRSIDQPLRANAVNITGTLNVLESMRMHGVKLIVFTSSSSVYGFGEEHDVLSEDLILAPPHPYGVGKLAAEHYVRVYGELFSIGFVNIRLFSVYGTRQLGTIEKAAVIPKLIHQARTGNPLTVYGTGEQKRNFTFVDDAVRALLLAAEKQAARGHIINLANPEEISILQIAQTIQAVTKTTSSIEHLAPLKGDPKRNPADVTKMQSLLGFTPSITYEEGIRKAVEWYDETYN